MVKIDWAAAGVFIPTIFALVGWGIAVEVRLSRQSEARELQVRMKNLEDLMVPLLVDWKVQQELQKRIESAKPTETTKVVPPVDLLKPLAPLPREPHLYNNAKKWAESAVQQRPPER